MIAIQCDKNTNYSNDNNGYERDRHLLTTARTSDDSPYLSSDLSKPALSSRSEPPPPGENGGLRCTVLYLPGPRKRISEDSLRTHKPNFPLMDSWEIHYYGVLQSFRLGGFGFTNALNYSPLSSFSLCLDHTFLKGELAKDEAPFLSSSLFFCCMCATVVYPPTHPGLLHVRRATRMSFFVLHLREE